MCTTSEVNGGPAPVRLQTVIDQFAAIVQQNSEQPAVVSCQQKWDLYGFENGKRRQCEYLRWTYGVLDQAVQSFAFHLSSYDLKPGMPLLIFSHNRVECLVACLGAYYLGLIHVPISPESLLNLGDAQYLLDTVCNAHGHQKIVVIAAADIAKSIDQLILPQSSVKIAFDESVPGWITFESLMEPAKIKTCQSSTPAESILFTSGSTSRPKGCQISADRWFNSLQGAIGLGQLEPTDVTAFLLPNHHAYGHICMIMPLLRGSCLVIASPEFHLQTAAHAITHERCTTLALVGTMAFGLLELLPTMECESLKLIVFAGMTISPDLVRSCFKRLGLASVENFYGMTEGVFSTTGPITNPDYIIKSQDLSIGGPIPGLKMRVCSSRNRMSVPYGVVGELHVSGGTMVQGYLGGEHEDFYDEDGEKWFITGDTVMMDEKLQLYIMGRYKDTIIRGGENISPARIEAVIETIPTFSAAQPVVIKKKDPIAGEVPVVILRESISDEQAKLLRDTVRSALGITHVPTEILSLQTLGIEEYPQTSAGKIKRKDLTEMVAFNDKRTPNAALPASVDWNMSVTKAWGQVLGVAPVNLDLNAPLAHLADSILMLTARDRIRKDTGQAVPIDTWMKTMTLSEQIALLESQAQFIPPGSLPPPASEMQRFPPGVKDMIHLGGNADLFPSTKIAVQETITPFCLSWQDVQDVFPL
ncbi:hypothetical protein PDIDSM_3550 [Penicillium digitatum]|nr:hypothetical protein PDIDSM_3550 [Penicillium digitatum]